MTLTYHWYLFIHVRYLLLKPEVSYQKQTQWLFHRYLLYFTLCDLNSIHVLLLHMYLSAQFLSFCEVCGFYGKKRTLCKSVLFITGFSSFMYLIILWIYSIQSFFWIVISFITILKITVLQRIKIFVSELWVLLKCVVKMTYYRTFYHINLSCHFLFFLNRQGFSKVVVDMIPATTGLLREDVQAFTMMKTIVKNPLIATANILALVWHAALRTYVIVYLPGIPSSLL